MTNRKSTVGKMSTYPWFLKSLAPDLVHLPLNDVPLLMRNPYVVTIHDMSSFLFGAQTGIRENLRLYRFRRGLLRADRVIAVSTATRRDVENLLGIRPDRMRLVYSAPDPNFLKPQSEPASREKLRERFQIQYPFVLYAGRIRPHKNIPRLIEAFAVVRGELENHPVYKDLRLIIIGDEISRNPGSASCRGANAYTTSCTIFGIRAIRNFERILSAASAFAFPFAL